MKAGQGRRICPVFKANHPGGQKNSSAIQTVDGTCHVVITTLGRHSALIPQCKHALSAGGTTDNGQ